MYKYIIFIAKFFLIVILNEIIANVKHVRNYIVSVIVICFYFSDILICLGWVFYQKWVFFPQYFRYSAYISTDNGDPRP